MSSVNPLYPRKYTCPICKTSFTSFQIRSSAVFVEKRESDFHVIYRGTSPLHYSIIVCPECYYAASNKSFNKEIPAKQADQLAVALMQLRPAQKEEFGKERTPEQALKCFQQAIRTAQLKKAPPEELAGLLLGSAWIARETLKFDLESTYLNEALNQYLEAFQNGSGRVGNLSDVKATYLIGELHRRIGNFSEAVNWFNNVITHKDIKQNPQTEKLAREQWALTRQESLENPDSRTSNSKDQDNSTETRTKNIPTAVSSGNSPTPALQKKRPLMQMPMHFYADQIDWLNQLVNRGYETTGTLVTREQVVRACLDACMHFLDSRLPAGFKTEKDLYKQLAELLPSNNMPVS